ncbi:MAG: 4-hydroxythreonine-4-phosphate dehydrogenase PdxA [Syntrophorhabdaceae bacterium]
MQPSGTNRIALTMGDPAGIGAEILVKSLAQLSGRSIPVIVGDEDIFRKAYSFLPSIPEYHFKELGHGRPGDVEFLDVGHMKNVTYGRSDEQCGKASYHYIIEALKLIFSGSAQAIVTCPIAKASLRMAGIEYPGHTEMLAHFGGVDTYVMMLANPKIRVSLVTIHIPVADVPPRITRQTVFDCIRITSRALEENLGIRKPFLKICGLNPHAGEKGMIGHEEDEITKAIDQARLLGMHVAGPYPADSIFHRIDCDAYIAMYHDQGLIPVKTLDFEKTVNITLGLPFVRTSPGHGTGFDIAGLGIANPASLIEAYRTAERMIVSRPLR